MPITFHEPGAGPREAACLPEAGEVHVWTAIVPAEEAELGHYFRALSADERQRAAQFMLDEPRQQFVLARGLLRSLLGECLSIAPTAIVFGTRPGGKPFLANGERSADLRFNVAHSGRRVAVALAAGREVGVDIEAIQPLPDLENMAGRIFSIRELAEWRSFAAEQRTAAFYRGWTRKEAWLKATGLGLIDDLGAVEVTLGREGTPQLVRLPEGADAARWEMAEVPLDSDYAGAVVFQRDFAEGLRPKGIAGELNGGRTRN